MTWSGATVVSGLLGSSSALTQELLASDMAVRAPSPLSRRIGFVQLSGGCGTSTAAAYVVSLLAHRRPGMVLAVNASAGPVHVLTRAGLSRSAVARDGHLRAHARTAREAQAGLPRSGSGLYGLDLAVGGEPVVPATWFDQVTPIGRFFDIVCTDWGGRHESIDLQSVAAASHAICLVARADRHSAERAAALVSTLVELESRPSVVVALVDVGRTGDGAPRLLRQRLSVPVLPVPYEPRYAAVRPPTSRALPGRSRLAQTRLATALMAQEQS
jgi:hypothetical protein